MIYNNNKNKMNMKKANVYELNQIFTKLKEFGDTKFKYSILKNLNTLKLQVSILSELEESFKSGISGFDEARNNLIIEIGKRKDDGTVFIDVQDEEMLEKFNKRFEKLVEEHKEALDEYNKKIQEFQEILEEEVEEELNFRKIDLDSCPDSGITAEELEKLIEFDIIIE